MVIVVIERQVSNAIFSSLTICASHISWFYCFFGTLAMAAGQLFGASLYPVMSNTGILIFIITIEAVMLEVDKDIVAIENEASFLVCVALKGDQISVARPSTVEQQQQQRNDGNNIMLHDEETPSIISDQVDTGVVASNLAESEGQHDAEGNFLDDETPTSLHEEDLNVKNNDATDDNDHNKESEGTGATAGEPSQLENTSNGKKER